MISLVYDSSNLVIVEMLISICLVCILQCYKEQYVSDDAASDWYTSLWDNFSSYVLQWQWPKVMGRRSSWICSQGLWWICWSLCITYKSHVVLVFVSVQQCNQITHRCISCLQILSKICTVPEQLLWTLWVSWLESEGKTISKSSSISLWIYLGGKFGLWTCNN